MPRRGAGGLGFSASSPLGRFFHTTRGKKTAAPVSRQRLSPVVSYGALQPLGVYQGGGVLPGGLVVVRLHQVGLGGLGGLRVPGL